MSLIVVQPNVNTTPDLDQGASSAVTGISNTGHGATASSAGGEGDTEIKTAKWSSFSPVGGQKSSIVLKIDHTSSGALSGVTANNSFTLEYSLNGGSSWATAVSRSNFTALQGPTTFSIALPNTQDISQVQVRDKIQASTDAIGHTATATVTIANIKLEVTTSGQQVIVMM